MRSNRAVVCSNASSSDIPCMLPFSAFALKACPLDRSPKEPVHFESNHLAEDSSNMHFKETPNWLEVMAPEARAIMHIWITDSFSSWLKCNKLQKLQESLLFIPRKLIQNSSVITYILTRTRLHRKQ